MTRGSLAGRGAVVTGGGRGIGAAVARLLSGAGAAVAIAARSAEELERTAGEIRSHGGTVTTVSCDVSEEDGVKRLAEAARERLGTVDILVLSAGSAASAQFRSISPADWDRMMAVNARSAFLCAREFVTEMASRKWGRIIAIASFAGLAGGKYIAHYSASKHAVVGLTRCLALEFLGSGVTANAICPGYVDTAMTERTLANVRERTGLSREEALAAVLRTTGQERLLEPEEVAVEVLKLCGEEAREVTGRTIVLGTGASVA